MKKGEIVCDTCKKIIARLNASKEVYDALDAVAFEGAKPEGERFADIECAECIVKHFTQPPIPPPPKQDDVTI